MARSTYIYHVRRIKCDTLLASGTVKYEMERLFENNVEYPRDTVKMTRVRDGKIMDEEEIAWTKCKTCCDSGSVPLSREPCSTAMMDCPDCPPTAKEVAHKLAEQFRRNGNYDTKGFYR